MTDFTQMSDEQKRAWALQQAILKSTLEDSPEATVARAKAYFDYVFARSSFTVVADRFAVTSPAEPSVPPQAEAS